MSDTEHKRYRKLYKTEFELAQRILADEGGALEWSPYDYEVFTYKAPGVSLVFYPHRTSASNYHIRVRDQNSKNSAEADRIMDKLDTETGFNCTFSRKSRYPIPQETERRKV